MSENDGAYPPAERGEPVELPAPDLGRCINGISEFGFVACDGHEPGTVYEPTVAVGPPPVPQPHQQVLPATGVDTLVLVVLGCALVAGGWLVNLVSRKLRVPESINRTDKYSDGRIN